MRNKDVNVKFGVHFAASENKEIKIIDKNKIMTELGNICQNKFIKVNCTNLLDGRSVYTDDPFKKRSISTSILGNTEARAEE